MKEFLCGLLKRLMFRDNSDDNLAKRLSEGDRVRITTGNYKGKCGTVEYKTDLLKPVIVGVNLDNEDDITSKKASEITPTSELEENVRGTLNKRSIYQKIKDWLCNLF